MLNSLKSINIKHVLFWAAEAWNLVKNSTLMKSSNKINDVKYKDITDGDTSDSLVIDEGDEEEEVIAKMMIQIQHKHIYTR